MKNQDMTEQPRIGGYRFGCVEIDGQTYTSDVVILPTGVKRNWWREEGHTLRPGDLSAVLEASPKALVVGQGVHGRMRVPDDTLACLKQAGIEVVCAPTGSAVEIYNERSQRGEVVAAALHLTC
ncbi:MAG: Mth938-like domain-containing protein [Phycisphaerae bacterium]